MARPPARLVEAEKSEFGGLGLISRRDFESGDVVLVETPFLSVPDVDWEDLASALSDSSSSSSLIRAAVAKLDEEKTYDPQACARAISAVGGSVRQD